MAKRSSGARQEATVRSAAVAKSNLPSQPPSGGVLLRGLTTSVYTQLCLIANEASSDGRGIPPNKLIVRLLNRLGDNPSLLRQLLSNGEPSVIVDEFAKSLESLTWAEHAASRGNLTAAIRGYSELLRRLGASQFKNVAQIARYGCAYAYLDLAERLEYEAIKRSQLSHFREADKLLCQAIAIQDDYLELEPNTNTVKYNNACAMALRIRVRVHAFLSGNNDSTIALLRDALPDSYDDPAAVRNLYAKAWGEKAWGENEEDDDRIGNVWRARTSESFVKSIDDCGLECVEALERLTRPTENATEEEISVYVQRAARDADLIALRYDVGGFQRDFETWSKRWQKSREGEDVWLQTCRAVLKYAQPEVLEHASQLPYYGLCDFESHRRSSDSNSN